MNGYLASGSGDKTVRLWDLRTSGAEPRILRGREFDVRTIAFSPDSRILASGSGDNTVRLWSLTNLNAEPRLLRGHESAVRAVVFRPDGRTLVSASRDTTVRIWRLIDDDLVNLACQITGRNLSQAEWRQYRGDEPYHKTCKNLPSGPSLDVELRKAGDILLEIKQIQPSPDFIQ